MTEYQSVFKSAQAEATYMATYNRALEKWPMPYETEYVPTAYGDTHIIISGPEDGEPLILVHSAAPDATCMHAFEQTKLVNSHILNFLSGNK